MAVYINKYLLVHKIWFVLKSNYATLAIDKYKLYAER